MSVRSAEGQVGSSWVNLEVRLFSHVAAARKVTNITTWLEQLQLETGTRTFCCSPLTRHDAPFKPSMTNELRNSEQHLFLGSDSDYALG